MKKQFRIFSTIFILGCGFLLMPLEDAHSGGKLSKSKRKNQANLSAPLIQQAFPVDMEYAHSSTPYYASAPEVSPAYPAVPGPQGQCQFDYVNKGISSQYSKNQEVNYYSIPNAILVSNETDFNRDCIQYEDALRDLQIVLIVDYSGSQGAGDDYPFPGTYPKKGMLRNQWTQWDNTYMITKYLAEAVFQYDRDGRVPVIFFSNHVKDHLISSPGELFELFEAHKPDGGTNLAGALRLAFDKYTDKSKGRTLFIVLTDGRPNDGQERQVHDLIKNKITRLDPQGDHLNVMFIRIGDNPDAIRFLAELDDNRQIGQNVDTKSDNRVYEMGPKTMILNAIFEHLDQDYQD